MLVLAAIALASQLPRLRVPRPYTLYAWASVLVILCLPIAIHVGGDLPRIDSLASEPRYLSIIFPLYIPLLRWSASSAAVWKATILVSMTLSVYLTVLMVAGIWIG